ncbi:hypothetical protein GPECTOR_68g377 [Gonium pectorale]|uniref:Uncharacterized protein n=1 Tax=Gonium pectorale TaxID=33097 RepID=A0A150G3F6_GONPE|nr:hypothetical protein GPECTOR_68g377 [Gonium pectorale]|eukprot:KXZ44406.1 hypothetical protein GPECTOR_68g377 [Gonium pectorale]
MSRYGRLPPVEDAGEEGLGFLQGRQLLPSSAPSTAPSKALSSQEQFAAVFGYAPNEGRHLASRETGASSDTPHSGMPASRDGKGRKAGLTVRHSMLHGTAEEEMQQTLGYRTKRKGEHDLTPAQQRAFQFRSAINKSTRLKPNPHANITDGTLLGTVMLQKDLKPFSSSTRLPYQTAQGPNGLAGDGGTYFLMPPVDVSMADAYDYNVPAGVRTGEDAVRLFSSSAAKAGLIIYCNLNPDSSPGAGGKEYNPYDLLVVDRSQVDPRHHYVLTQSGVTQMLGGHAQDLQPFHAWQRDRNLFTVLRKLVFFKHNEVSQAFWQWRAAVRALKYRARQNSLAHELLVLSPTFHRPLLNVRRMTLAVSSDTNGTWRKTPDGRWVEVEPELPIQPGVPRMQTQSQLQQLQPPQPHPLAPPPPPPAAQDSMASGSALTTEPSAAASTSSATGTGAGAPSSAAAEPTGGSGSGLEVALPTPLPPERLPESGLPYQLGYVGTVHEQYSLADFKRMREEQRNMVASALQEMVAYVRSQVQLVGQAVQADLAAAQAAVAKPTRQEARKQRFEAPGSQAWKAKSLALVREDRERKQQHLEDAVHAAQQLVRFITLADCLMLGQLAELARLAVLLSVRQLELPRKAGLYIVAGIIEDLTGVAGVATVTRGAGLPAWGRTSTFASTAAATMSRRRSAASMVLFGNRPASQAGDGGSTMLRTGTLRSGLLGDGSDGDADDTDSGSEPDGMPAAAPAFIFTPSAEELSLAVANLPREVVNVVIAASSPLRSYPEVRQLFNDIAAKGIIVPPSGSSAGRSYEAIGSLTLKGGGYGGEVLRGSVDVRGIMTRLQVSILSDYNSVMHHPYTQPYRGHEVQWGMVSRFTVEAYRNTSGLSPEQLHADLTATGTWLAEMNTARSNITVGLVALDMSALQRAALPAIQKTYSGIMSLLGGLLVAQSQQLTSRLTQYTGSLVARPSQLADFVVYVEVIWAHLDPLSATRQAISTDLEHMARLHSIFSDTSDRSSSPTLYHPLYGAVEVDYDDDDMLVDPSKPPSYRRVMRAWENLQASVQRYTEEARAAAEYFQNAAGLMVKHLKTALIESGNALQQLLQQLRNGPSTDPSAEADAVGSHLDNLNEGLGSLAASVEQHSSWARLLTHPSTSGLVAQLETQLGAARSVLSGRRTLWDVVAGWRKFMDRLYAVPCIDDERQRLMAELAEHVGRLRVHAGRITSLHTDDDLTSTKTVTPAEQKLGAHLTLLVKSWQEILPLAQQLVHPSVKPRHLRTLLGWLSAHRAAAAAAPNPVTAGAGSTPATASTATAPPSIPLLLMHDPYTVPPTHVREDESSVAEVAGRVSLAQLLALGEGQLAAWLTSIQERVAAIPLTYSSSRNWGSFTPTNVPEAIAALGALTAELAAVQRSPFYGGVLREYERVEQLIGGVLRSLQDTAACLDLWTYMCQLLANPIVAERAPEAASSMEMMGTAWRKLNMAAMEQPTLTGAAAALQVA